MSLRIKVWLLVAASVALSVAALSTVRDRYTRRLFREHAKQQAQRLAEDIAKDFRSLYREEPRVTAPTPERRLRSTYLRQLGKNRPAKAAPRATSRTPVPPEGDGSPSDQSAILFANELEDLLLFHPSLRWIDLRIPHGEGHVRLWGVPDKPIHWTRVEKGDPPNLSHYVINDHEHDALVVSLPFHLGQRAAVLRMSWGLEALSTIIDITERSSLLFSGLLLVALAFAAAFVTHRVVVRRLENLAAAIHAVERGNLSYRLDDEASDEIGRLNQQFNKMAVRLSAAAAEIAAFNQRLAAEIQAATLDLQQKNKELDRLNRILGDLRHDNASKLRLAALGQLAASLAHEVGTPLSSVSGHLQLALMSPVLPEAVRERLTVVSREVARIDEIFRRYLHSTRGIQPDVKPTDLGAVIQEAIDVVCSAEHHKNVTVTSTLDLPALFRTDGGLLRQVLVNLLSNAHRAVAEGGHVSIIGRDSDGVVELSVSDDGPGLPGEIIDRIFEPFYTTKRHGHGTGLGLAISRQIVHSLGGSLTASNGPQGGALFTLVLPEAGVARKRGSSHATPVEVLS